MTDRLIDTLGWLTATAITATLAIFARRELRRHR